MRIALVGLLYRLSFYVNPGRICHCVLFTLNTLLCSAQGNADLVVDRLYLQVIIV